MALGSTLPPDNGLFPAVETTAGRLRYASLPAFAARQGCDLAALPRSVRVMLEAALCAHGRGELPLSAAATIAGWQPGRRDAGDYCFPIARVLLQDAAGVPVIADMAALRDVAAAAGIDPASVRPTIPFALVVDHAVQIDWQGSADAERRNLGLEMERNRERYLFLKWAAQAFPDFVLVPPGNGIVHQVHMEHLAVGVAVRDGWLTTDSVIGTDSHTTMVNGLGILGWGVGGIEAESALLGDPLTIEAPEVVGIEVTGALRPGVLATDIALTLTRQLRQQGVTGAFLEFHGSGLGALSVEDRTTLANMAPEYGATLALFPVDEAVLAYLAAKGRSPAQVDLIRDHLMRQGLFGTVDQARIRYDRALGFDLSAVQPSIAGPVRPDQLVALGDVPAAFERHFPRSTGAPTAGIGHGQILLAAITSCTNTANPRAMIAAGLFAEAAAARGLTSANGVRTSFAPGSRAVPAYLARLGLMAPLERFGFHVAAFGCAACVGNSGPLDADVEQALATTDAIGVAVLSGNRNFEARVHPSLRAAYLMSPALVVAYAIAGRMDLDLTRDPLGVDGQGRPVRLGELWPDADGIEAAWRTVAGAAGPAFVAPPGWDALPAPAGGRFAWDAGSTFLQPPPFFAQAARPFGPLAGAVPLLVLGDDVTTDHISPVGPIPAGSPSARYLAEQGVAPDQIGTYAARRVNHDVMVRGTFANPRLRNRLVPGREGPVTRHIPSGDVGSLVEVAERYAAEGRPLVVIAGRNYGMGSARDWAAKGTALLGVRAVMASGFERIHRSNLIRLGVAPIELADPGDLAPLVLSAERVEIDLVPNGDPGPRSSWTVRVRTPAGTTEFPAILRADTDAEIGLLEEGGVFHAFLRQMRQQRPADFSDAHRSA